MKKYMILMFMPLVFQGNVYCQDNINININKVILPELIRARNMMNNNVKLELNDVLQSFFSYAQKGLLEKSLAIVCLQDMKIALEKFRFEQYPSFMAHYFYPTPAVVRNQINPAILKIDKVLQDLKVSSNSYGYYYAKLGGITLIPLALFFIGTGVLKAPGKNNPLGAVAVPVDYCKQLGAVAVPVDYGAVAVPVDFKCV